MDASDVLLIQQNQILSLRKQLEEAQRRILEQAVEIMELQATLSNSQKQVGQQKLWEQFGLQAKRAQLPPRIEFEAGCRAFQDQVYSSEWSDFFELMSSGSK